MKSFTIASLATVAVLAITANAAESELFAGEAVHGFSSSNPLIKRQLTDEQAGIQWCQSFFSVCPQAAIETCGPVNQYQQVCVATFKEGKCFEYKALCACRVGPGSPVKDGNALALQKTYAITNDACKSLPTYKEPYDPNNPFGNTTNPVPTNGPTQSKGVATQTSSSTTNPTKAPASGSPSAFSAGLTSAVLAIAGSLSVMYL